MTIALLTLLACAGLLWGFRGLLQARTLRLTGLIQSIEQKVGAAEAGLAQPEPTGPAARLLTPLQRLMPAALLQVYADKLSWAGRPYGLDAVQFAGLKLAATVAVPLLVAAAVGLSSSALLLTALVAGFFLPDGWLGGQVAQRQRQVAEELPLFTDLIATAVEAGCSLTEAVRRVAADVPGLVAREFLRAVQEMAAGKPRMQAWRDLLNRLPGDDLRTIVSAIMQAEQYGTSVSEILRYQVQQIRSFKVVEAQRLAQSTSVKMRIPMLDLEEQPMLSWY
jgi:tight adherence protein C